MSKDKARILYVDDEEHNLLAFKATFRRYYKVFTAIGAVEATEILNENPDIEIVITDQRMPGMTGVEFLSSIRVAHPDPIRILLTGFSDIEAVIGAINQGEVYRYLQKPWDEKDLQLTIESAYEVFRLRKENKELMKKLLEVNEQLEFMIRQKLLS